MTQIITVNSIPPQPNACRGSLDRLDFVNLVPTVHGNQVEFPYSGVIHPALDTRQAGDHPTAAPTSSRYSNPTFPLEPALRLAGGFAAAQPVGKVFR